MFGSVDYKCGIRLIESSGEIKAAKNCASLSKEDGSLREVLYAEFTAANELDEIPFYDLPLKSGVKHDFLNMSEGAGRQEGLFTYMNPIKAAGFEYEQFKEVVKLIEQFIFKVPLGNEFENAIRREAWDSIDITNNSKFYNQKGQFLHNKFGDYLINKYHVGLLNGYMYSYKEGVYVPGYVHIERNILKEIPILTRTKYYVEGKSLETISNEVKKSYSYMRALKCKALEAFQKQHSKFLEKAKPALQFLL